jgi:putative Ca2+/H+ antiporter (TMEM165/GDT1 family)
MADAFLVSTGAVALAELGDKTQLLGLLLVARFRRPWPIIAGILVATLLNHALSAWLGELLARQLTPEVVRWVLGLGFLATAAWTLKPDRLDDDDAPRASHGIFVSSLVAFFLAEIGDKTQLATGLLAARYQPLWQVIAGTTFGMLLVNVPTVLLGERFARRLPLAWIRRAAALLFAVLGAWILLATAH